MGEWCLEKKRVQLAVLFAFVPLLTGCMPTGVGEDEKALLITIDDLAASGVAVGTASQGGENYFAPRYLNATTEVEYGYDSDNDPGFYF